MRSVSVSAMCLYASNYNGVYWVAKIVRDITNRYVVCVHTGMNTYTTCRSPARTPESTVKVDVFKVTEHYF